MADYLELPLVDDPDALTELGVDYLQESIDGYTARPGNVETVLLEANGQIGAEVVSQASLVAPIIFAYLGQNLLGIAPLDAVSATASADVTFTADAVVTLDAGSMIAVPNPDGTDYVFTLDDDVISPVGGGVVQSPITALEPGASANGSYGAAELIDVVDGVQSINVASASAGGADEETDDDYLNRLTSAMTILAPRPILPGDHAVLAQQVPGVGRALAIDLLLPGTTDAPQAIRDPNETKPPPSASQTNVARCTTVAITADDGSAPSQTLKQTVWNELDSHREVNFLNFVIQPTYTTIEVQATLVAYKGFGSDEVLANALASLADWLNPATWGGTPSSTSELADDWTHETTVRLYEAVDYLNRASGVSYVVSVQLRVQGGAFAANDVQLTGLAPLPLFGQPGSAITVQTP